VVGRGVCFSRAGDVGVLADRVVVGSTARLARAYLGARDGAALRGQGRLRERLALLERAVVLAQRCVTFAPLSPAHSQLPKPHLCQSHLYRSQLCESQTCVYLSVPQTPCLASRTTLSGAQDTHRPPRCEVRKLHPIGPLGRCRIKMEGSTL
jgi:hypothetical protein